MSEMSELASLEELYEGLELSIDEGSDEDIDLFMGAIDEMEGIAPAGPEDLTQTNDSQKVGVQDSVTDSLLETIAFSAGIPMSIVDSFVEVGFAMHGQKRDKSIVGPMPFSVGWLLNKFKGEGIGLEKLDGVIEGFNPGTAINETFMEVFPEPAHTGTAFEDRSTGGQVAKAVTDFAGMAVPGVGAERAVALGTQAARNMANQSFKAVDDVASFGTAPMRSADELAQDVSKAQQITKTREVAAAQPAVFGGKGERFTPSNITKEKMSVAIGEALEFTAKNPGKSAAIQAGSVAGGAQLGGIVTGLNPEAEKTRFAAEVVGSIVNPTGLVIRVGGAGVGLIQNAIGTMTKAGKEARAADLLASMLRESGEIPSQEAMDAFIAQLRAADLAGAELTAGQKTGLPAQMKLERWLQASTGNQGARFGQKADDMAEEGMRAFRDAIDALTMSGDPRAIAAAAAAREQFVNETVDGAVATARARQAGTAKTLELRDKSVADTGVGIHEPMDEAFTHLKGVEKELWGGVPKDKVISTAPIRKAYKVLREGDPGAGIEPRMVKEESFELEDSIKRIIKGDTVKSGEVQLIRSKIMSRSRDMRTSGNDTEAAVLEKMAEGLADSMEGLQGWATARAFTTRINDHFSRTFAGKVVSTSGKVEPKIDPELITHKSIGGGDGVGGGTTADIKSRQIREAGAFAVEEGAAPAITNKVTAEQNDFLRLLATRAIDEETGLVSAAKLNTFKQNHSAMLRRPEFAGLKHDVRNAESAAKALKKIEKDAGAITAEFKASAVGRMVGDDNPTRAVGRLLDGNTPTKDIQEMAGLAETAAQKEGLASAIMDHATSRAKNMSEMREAMTSAKYAQKSALEIIMDNKLISDEGAKKIRMLMDRAAEVEKNIKAGRALREEDFSPEIGSVYDLAVRIVGASLGAKGAVSTTGSSLVAASAGVRFLRKTLESNPLTSMQKVLIEAAQDPAYLARLLEKTTTKKKFQENVRVLNVPLGGALALAADEDR